MDIDNDSRYESRIGRQCHYAIVHLGKETPTMRGEERPSSHMFSVSVIGEDIWVLDNRARVSGWFAFKSILQAARHPRNGMSDVEPQMTDDGWKVFTVSYNDGAMQYNSHGWENAVVCDADVCRTEDT
jgi:hypothetical protein